MVLFQKLRIRVKRRRHIHTGVDLYTFKMSKVVAMEEGVVEAISKFTGDYLTEKVLTLPCHKKRNLLAALLVMGQWLKSQPLLK